MRFVFSHGFEMFGYFNLQLLFTPSLVAMKTELQKRFEQIFDLGFNIMVLSFFYCFDDNITD